MSTQAQIEKKEIDCPHCKGKIDVEFEKKIPKTKIIEESIDKVVEKQVEKNIPEIKEVIKEKTVVPSHIPAYKCKDGNCGRVHNNPNYTKKVKGRCTNCGQFTPDIDDVCPWCNSKEFDELDEDELKELGIPEPKEQEQHEHETI